MKRVMSLLLVMAMVLSMVPVVASAAESVEVLSVENESVTETGYTYTYTADSAGTLNVSVGACSPSWRYKIACPGSPESLYHRAANTDASANYTGDAGEWTIKFYAYSTSDYVNVAGTVSFDLTFTPSADSGEEEIVKTEYAVSDTKLALGDNALTTLETAITSIYAFKPTETGVYTFTAPAGAVVGNWGGGSWLLTDPKATSNTYEWTCTGVGQSAYIGVSGVEGSFNLNVAKTGDYTVVETPIVKYENKATLESFTIPTGAKLGSYVDVFVDTAHTAVYSEADGYYHLDSVDGDVLLIDMDYMDIILSAALKSDRPVMYAYMTDEDGNKFKYDIGDAVLAYENVMDANGYYPVTEDILLFYQVYAVQAGTYTFHVAGDYNEDCVWMYCMRTMNMDNVVLPEEPEEPEQTDPTTPSVPESSEPEESEPSSTPSEPEEPSSEPSEPEVSEPVDGTVVLNEKITADSSGKYVYTYETTEDGTLTVTVGDGSTKWSSDVIYFVGVSTTTVGSASGSDADSYSVQVSAGTKYRVRVWATSNGALAETPLTVVFKADGATEPSEPEDTEPTTPSVPEDTVPTTPSTPEESEPTTPSEPAQDGTLLSLTDEAVTASGYTFTYTAATAGTIHVSMGACTPSWLYKVYYPDGNVSADRGVYSAGPECDYQGGAGDWKIVFFAYSGATGKTDGTISLTVTFTPDESQGGDVEKNPHEVSATQLVTGNNNVTMLETAEATVFKFKPTEAGTYTITGPADAKVGNWGTNASYLTDPNSTGNTCQWTCSSVGQSVYIGVTGVEGEIILTVEKEEVPEESEPTTPSEPEESEPTDPSEPSEPETEPTIPSIPDDEVPSDAVYSLTVDGQTTYYTNSASSAINNVLKGVTGNAYMKLYTDLTLGTSSYNALEFKSGVVTVDLNGHTVTFEVASVGALYVDGGTLVVMDSSADGTGLVQNTHSSGYGIEVWSGTASLKSGSVYGGSNGVRLYGDDDFFYMEGGNVTAQKYALNAPAGSTAAVSGGVLHATSANQYAVYAASTASVTITGGYFNGSVSGAGLKGNVSGGYFIKAVSSSYLAEGCELQSNDDATYIYKVYNPNAVQPEPEEPIYVAAVYADGEAVASYESLAAAVAACAQGQYVVLLQDVTENVTVASDLYLDLAGFDVNGTVTVAEGAALYGMDSATDDYDCTDGYGTIAKVEGTVASNHRTDVTGKILRYLAVSDSGTVSFHRFYVGITAMSVAPATTSVGYKAQFWGDSVVKAQLDETDAFGFSLWLSEDKVVTAGAGVDKFVSGKTVSLRLQNFDVSNYGEENVNAQVYLKLSDGTVLTGTTQSYTLRSLVETVAADLSGFNAAQITALKAMCEKFAIMAKWNISSILNWSEEL